MDEQTPNIHVVESVWRRLKKAKLRDMEAKKDVKGGSGDTGASKPTARDTGTTENRGNR